MLTAHWGSGLFYCFLSHQSTVLINSQSEDDTGAYGKIETLLTQVSIALCDHYMMWAQAEVALVKHNNIKRRNNGSSLRLHRGYC